MRDPKKVLTDDGYRRYQAHLVNIAEGVNWILSHADDLYIEDHLLLALDKADTATGELLNKTDYESDEE